MSPIEAKTRDLLDPFGARRRCNWFSEASQQSKSMDWLHVHDLLVRSWRRWRRASHIGDSGAGRAAAAAARVGWGALMSERRLAGFGLLGSFMVPSSPFRQ